MIKADLRRVLDRMQVQYRETRSGFECIHAPSIDLTTVQADSVSNNRKLHVDSGGGVRRSLTKKASKLSFALKGRDRDGSPPKSAYGDASTIASATTAVRSDSTSSSLYNVSSNAHTVKPEEINGVLAEDMSKTAGSPANDATSNSTLDSSPTKGKNLPPIPRDYAPQPQTPSTGAPLTNLPTGEVDPDVFDSIGSNTLCVRFEINIIKVPWLPLHGIQFRRAGGDGWQYQMLARRVLTELKL